MMRFFCVGYFPKWVISLSEIFLHCYDDVRDFLSYLSEIFCVKCRMSSGVYKKVPVDNIFYYLLLVPEAAYMNNN